ncbi:protein kinase domain-containing protein [Tautonia plasticadhaerens]|uniref:Serine/threonine-protein kinase PknB n=1 Tax=Tautonia plasticadhaerens TaxID=2527974 RepID=A0A518HAC9_9BACT|nr:protein kinase [Tautonia plasticadhaerens]QDV37812.1 Serine/threonine-protein kinase PknB [Tautonia plasticadhaerens]
MNELDLFAAAIAIPDRSERVAYLDRECSGRAELRQRLDLLLDQHDRSHQLLDLPNGADRDDPTADHRASSLVGTVIAGRYKLLEQIGEGGMGTVWVAEQTEPVRRKVALKLIKTGMDSKAVLARFEAERQALAMMDHPNIAKVLDGGLTDAGRPFFVMEYVKGIPITEYCDSLRMNVADRLDLFVQACSAVQHAHQKGIIHRDLKPSNILVAPYDDRPVPKVIDFGLAKALHQRLTDRTLHTSHEAVIGTPLYMSPEQAQLNNLDVDTRSDVYSLGVLLYELLTGTTPLEKARFKQAAWEEIRRLIREEEPPRPSTRLSSTRTLPSLAACRQTEPVRLTRQLRGELDWIVMKTLEKDRTRRYETANGLAKDIQRFLAGETVEACPPTLGYRLAKLYRRNRGAVLTAGSFAAVLLIATVVSLAFAAMSARSERRARDQERAAAASARRAIEQEQVAATRARETLDANRALEDERERLIRLDYARSMQLAESSWRDGSAVNAISLLDKAPPGLRGWEWHYLDRLCRTGHRLSLEGHTGGVEYAAYDPTGERIVTTSEDKTAKVWDARTGALIHTLDGHAEGDSVTYAEFSPDGSQILTSGRKNETTKVWDARTGTEQFTLEGGTNLHDTRLFSRDGTQILTMAGAGMFVGLAKAIVSNARTGAEEYTIDPGETSPALQSAVFSPDGKRLLVVPVFESPTLWDARSGKKERSLDELVGEWDTVSFSPDGARVLTLGMDGKSARLWDVQTGTLIRTLEGQDFRMGSRVAFSPDGTRIFMVGGGSDGTAKIWDAETGRVTLILQGGGLRGARSATFSPDGERLLAADEGDPSARLWDARTGALIRTFNGHRGRVSSAGFSPDGASILTASRDETARVWDVDPPPGPLAFLQTGPDGSGWRIGDVTFSRDGSRIAVVWNQGPLTSPGPSEIRVWNVREETVASILPVQAGVVYSAEFSPDPRGTRLITVCFQRRLLALVWDVQTGEILHTLKGLSSSSSPTSFSSDGSMVVTEGGDPSHQVLENGILRRRMKVWDMRTGDPLRTLDGRFAEVSSAFSPDDTRILAADEGSVTEWDVRTGRKIRTVREGHAWLLPDGTRIVTLGGDNRAIVWDVETGREIVSLAGVGDMREPYFSPNGDRILTVTRDQTWKLWDAATGDELITLRPDVGAESVRFSPDGRWIVGTDLRGGVCVFDGTPLPGSSSP